MTQAELVVAVLEEDDDAVAFEPFPEAFAAPFCLEAIRNACGYLNERTCSEEVSRWN